MHLELEQDDGTQPPPLDELPLLDDDELPAEHAPLTHVPAGVCIVQSVQLPPPVPHVESPPV